MTKLFRIMVRGEDGVEFCYRNKVCMRDVNYYMEEAQEEFPCGDIFIERDSREPD